MTRAATILQLLGKETVQWKTRVKKSEPGLRKQLIMTKQLTILSVNKRKTFLGRKE